jgi:hypothetical protein
MKRIEILLVLLVFGFAFVASAEQPNLGELAKKEKARREALEKTGKKTKVLTNEDVGKIKSQLGMVSGSEVQEGQEGQPAEEDSSYTPPAEGEDYIPAQEPEQQPVDPNAEHKKQIEELQNQRDEHEKAAEEARANVGAGGLWHSHATGNQYKKASEAEQKIDEIDKRLDKTSTQQQQATQQPPQEEYVPPADETTEEAPAEEPPTEEPPPSL